MCRPAKQQELWHTEPPHQAVLTWSYIAATDVTKQCCVFAFASWCSARTQGSSWGSFMRLKPGRCSVRFVPFSPRLIPVGQTWLAISKKLSSVMSCLNVWMNFLVWQLYNTLNTSVGITLLMVIYHFSPSLHPPRISASPPLPSPPCCRCSRRSCTGRSMCGSWSAGTQTTGSRSKTPPSTARWRTWRRPWRDMSPPRSSCWTPRPSAASPTWWDFLRLYQRGIKSSLC